LCESAELETIVEVGVSGLSNNLEDSNENSLNSQKYPLDLFICCECNHVQLGEEVDPKIFFE
jgi:hypothetical protein